VLVSGNNPLAYLTWGDEFTYPNSEVSKLSIMYADIITTNCCAGYFSLR